MKHNRAFLRLMIVVALAAGLLGRPDASHAGFFDDVGDAVSGAANTVGDAVGDAVGGAIGAVPGGFRTVWSATSGFVNSAGQVVTSAANTVVGAVTRTAEGALSLGGSAMGAMTGAVSSAAGPVGNLVVDAAGTALSYDVVSGVTPIVHAVRDGAHVAMTQTADGVTIGYKGGIDGATNIGSVVISKTGEVGGSVLNTVVDGLEYAYAQGTIFVMNLLGINCGTIAELFGGDGNYNIDDRGGTAFKCSNRIIWGFDCAIPTAIMDIVRYAEVEGPKVIEAAYSSPCDKLPIPNLNLSCGFASANKHNVEVLSSCILGLRAHLPQGEAGLSGAVCQSIGETIFSVLLDVAVDGANTANVVTRIAVAVKNVYNLQQRLETVEEMVQQFCATQLADLEYPRDMADELPMSVVVDNGEADGPPPAAWQGAPLRWDRADSVAAAV